MFPKGYRSQFIQFFVFDRANLKSISDAVGKPFGEVDLGLAKVMLCRQGWRADAGNALPNE